MLTHVFWITYASTGLAWVGHWKSWQPTTVHVMAAWYRTHTAAPPAWMRVGFVVLLLVALGIDAAAWPLNAAWEIGRRLRRRIRARRPCRCTVCGERAPKGMITCAARIDAIVSGRTSGPSVAEIERHSWWHACHLHPGEPGSAYAKDGSLDLNSQGLDD